MRRSSSRESVETINKRNDRKTEQIRHNPKVVKIVRGGLKWLIFYYQ